MPEDSVESTVGAQHENNLCPVCGGEYDVQREIVEDDKQMSLRSDSTWCVEENTETRGGPGNWSKTEVKYFYVHR